MHILFVFVLSEEAKYTHTAFPLSSHQNIIKWLPTPFYTYGTVGINLTPPHFMGVGGRVAIDKEL